MAQLGAAVGHGLEHAQLRHLLHRRPQHLEERAVGADGVDGDVGRARRAVAAPPKVDAPQLGAASRERHDHAIVEVVADARQVDRAKTRERRRDHAQLHALLLAALMRHAPAHAAAKEPLEFLARPPAHVGVQRDLLDGHRTQHCAPFSAHKVCRKQIAP
eukprot:4499437-Pleurochrysis_carterae.AAC.1